LPQRAVEMYGFTERSHVYVGNFPLWTAGGYRWALIAWSARATVIIHQAADLHQPLFRHSLTHIFATPASLYALMYATKGVARRNDATRLMVTGGAMSKAMWLAAKQCVTRQVSAMLVSTEALVAAITPIEHSDDLLWHRIDPSREVQVVDERGSPMPVGQRARCGYESTTASKAISTTRSRRASSFATVISIRATWANSRRTDGCRCAGASPMSSTCSASRSPPARSSRRCRIASARTESASCRSRVKTNGRCTTRSILIEAGRKLEHAEIEAAADAELGQIKRVPVHIEFVAMMPRNDMGKIDRRALKEELMRRRGRPTAAAR